MARRSGLFLLLAAVLIVAVSGAAAAVPPTCERIECPAYEVVDGANGFEIRRYKDAMWMSTAPIEDISFVAATRTGFLQCYYRCTYHQDHCCPASKHVEQHNSEDPPLFRVIYTNEHTCSSAAASDYMASSMHIQQIADASLRKVEMERPPRLQAQCSGGYTTVIKEEKDACVSSLLTVITGCDVAKSDAVHENTTTLLARNCYNLSPTAARSSHEGSSSSISPVVLPASDDPKMDFLMESLESHWFEPLDLGWFKESTHTS